MSQILEALRRAEAQRSRGRVPGLHETAGQVILQPTQAPVARANRALLIAAAVLMTVLLIGLLLIVGRSGDSAQHPVASTPSPPVAVTSTAGTETAPSLPPGSLEPLPVSAAPELPAIVGLPRMAQIRENPAEQPREQTVGVVAQKPMSATPPAVRSAAEGVVSAPGASRPAGQVVMPALRDLPPDVQRSLPPITVSGSVYSSEPAQRMLVVNGEIWHEGDQIRPGLVLEQIRRRDAVLRYNGTRFTVGP